MEERISYKSKKSYNPLQQKISSQLKRIEELLKSGDIPWRRVKSAYKMSQLALSQSTLDLKSIYPLKQYLKLVQLIFNQLLQGVEDQLEDDISNKIEYKLIGTKIINSDIDGILNTKSNKYKINKKTTNNNNGQNNEKDFIEQFNTKQSQKDNENIDILEKYKYTNQSLVQIELKKVIDSFDESKASLIQMLMKNQNKTKSNQILSQNFKTELNNILGQWKEEIGEKHKQLNKYIQQNKIHYEQQLKKKDMEIERLSYANGGRYQRSNCGTQTMNDFRVSEKRMMDQEIEFNLEKERFLRVTKGYQKEIIQLKKYNKTLRTSSHMKLDQYQKSIIDLNKEIKYIKREFKQYFYGNRETEDIFFNIYERHQKAKTPFIPKSQIHQVYEKLKSKEKKDSLILFILTEEEKEKDPGFIGSKKSIMSQKDVDIKRTNTKNKKVRKNNEPLMDVANIPSKIDNFQTGKKLRNSMKTSSNKPSLVLNKEDFLPLIKVLDNTLSKNISSQNTRSLYQPKPFPKNQLSLNYLSITSNPTNDLKISPRTNLFDQKQISNSLYVQKSGPYLKLPSQGIESKDIKSIIKPLSRHASYDLSLSDHLDSNQTSDEIKMKSVGSNLNNKKYTTENNEAEKQRFDLGSDDHTGEYVIKINKVEDQEKGKQKEKGFREKKKNSIIGHKSKTIYIHNVGNSNHKAQRIDRETIKDNSSFKEKQKEKETVKVREREREKQKEIEKQKQPKQNRQILQNMQPKNKIDKPRQRQKKDKNTSYPNIKQASLINFQKQMNSFYQKYQKIQNYDQHNKQIVEGIQKVKKYHKMICTKQVCHHLRKFEDRLRKIQHQNSNKKPLKLAQLEIRHGSI